MLLRHQQAHREHPDDTRRGPVLTLHLYLDAPSLKGEFCRSPFEEAAMTELCRIFIAELSPIQGRPGIGPPRTALE